MSLYQPLSLIDGQWVGASSGATFDVINPATGQVLEEVADLSAEDCSKAVDAAEAAFPKWAALTAKERAVILRRWFNLINENAEPLAALITEEMGKPLAEARGEVGYGASFVDWFAEEGRRIYGDVIAPHMSDKRILAIKQPVGVVVAITPWNFPLAMITRKISPALAAGCTVVIKPSEDTPLTALAVCELANQAGMPAGVINCVTGLDASSIGQALTGDSRVRKVTFTGSTEVGKILYRQCAASVKKLSLELGGNAPFIVFDDADLDAAVDGAMLCKFRNAGQTCVCANRILVQSGIHDRFVEVFLARVKAMKVATFIALTRAKNTSTNRSWIPLCTKIRFAQTQVCPAFRNLQSIAPSTAASRSASSKTMNGALPPNSNESFFTLAAHWRYKILPTSVEPVKVTFRTRLSPVRA